MSTQTLAQAVRATLHAAMSASDEVVLLGETVGRMGGIGGSTAGLLAAFGPERVRDLPIADRGTIGLALGLALGGKRPVVELSGSNRLFAVLDTLAEAAAIARRGEFAAPLVVRVPYGTEAGTLDRPLGHLAIDGLTVVCAADGSATPGLLRAALAARGPVVLLEPRAAYEDRVADPDGAATPFRARTVRSGSHVTLAAWGNGVRAALDAASALAAEGIDAEVIDLVALQPLDHEALAASVTRTGRLVVVHPGDPALADAARMVGLDGAFLHLESPLARASEAPEAVARAAREAVQF